MAKNKKVVYTAIAGRYDELVDHSYVNPDWDYVCFSDLDLSSNKNKSWTIKPLIFDKLDATRNNRWHKLNPHLALPEYEHSVYIDANAEVVSKAFFDMIDNVIHNDGLIALSKHPDRDCIYDELQACIDLSKDDPTVMNQQIKYIKESGYPAHNGLYANFLIYRQHTNSQVIVAMDKWWKMVSTMSRRDQLSLPFVLWQSKLEVTNLPVTAYIDDDKVKFWPHNSDARDEIIKVIKQLDDAKYHNQLQHDKIVELDQELRAIKTSRSWKAARKISKISGDLRGK